MNERALFNAFDPLSIRNWTRHFFDFNTKGFADLQVSQPENFWHEAGAKRALNTFHQAAVRVPAYKDFLKKQGVSHVKIKTIQDFAAHVPILDKESYVNKYSLQDRCWAGQAGRANIVAVSSGTSGDPKFWPRGGFPEFEASVIHELLYTEQFGIAKKKTLVIIGFPMGVYVSGMATVLPSWLIANKGYDLTIVSVGTNKHEVLRAVRHLGAGYEQIILIGHPFFLKDVIETGKEDGINWNALRVNLMFCSEGFNERWRRYVISKLGKNNSKSVVINTYGCSELLLVASESAVTTALRELYDKKSGLCRKVFKSDIVPHIFQYNPFLRYIESVGNELLFTVASSAPLIRYNLHDQGVVCRYDELSAVLPKNHEDVHHGSKLPFVVLTGRTDSAIIFYAANIYQAHIQACLNHSELMKHLTGRFFMRKDYLPNLDEFLELTIELRPKITAPKELTERIQSIVFERLKSINMEYLFISQHLGKDVRPHVITRPYQHEQYFKPGLKPKYL